MSENLLKLPGSVRIAEVTLRVRTGARQLEFYSRVLGFRSMRESDRYVVVLRWFRPQRDSRLILLEDLEAPPRPPRTTGLYHLAIRVAARRSLALLFNRLREAGWPLHGAADHGVSEAIYLPDAEGNGLELYVDRPRERWPVAGDRIAMVTEPLDLEDLLATLHDDDFRVTWPPPADIGHIHLQVSSLERARTFYCDALGFRVRQDTFPGALFVAAGDYHHHVGLNIWDTAGAPPPPRGSLGLVSFTLELPDTEFAVRIAEQVERAGYPVKRLPKNAGEPGWVVEDPDGVQIVVRA